MEKYKIILTLTIGLVIAAGRIVAAQSTQLPQVAKPEQPERLAAPEKRAEVVSVLPGSSPSNAATQPIELRLLDETGKIIAQVRVEFPKGQQLEIGTDKMTVTATEKDTPKRRRLEGNIYIKTLRGTVSTTLLKMDGKDAIVEYVMPENNL